MRVGTAKGDELEQLGRAICGWLCPFGLLQELIHKIPSPKRKLKKGFLYIKYAVLVVFVLRNRSQPAMR